MTLSFRRYTALARGALFAAAAFAPGLAFAQEAPAAAPEAPPRPAWVTGCSAPGRGEPLECTAEQRLVATNSGRLVLQMSIRVRAGQAPVLLVQGPLGILVNPGFTLVVDGGATETLPVQFCDPAGCYAATPLSDALLQAMIKGQKLNVRFTDSAHRNIDATVTLAGFSDAYSKIR